MSGLEQKELAESTDNARKAQLRAGSRLLASDRSAFSMSFAGLNKRQKPGLGLPGAGWFDRERARLRESDRPRA